MEQNWKKNIGQNGETVFVSNKYKIQENMFAYFQIFPTPFGDEKCIILHCFPCSGVNVQILVSHLPHMVNNPEDFNSINEIMFEVIDNLCLQNCENIDKKTETYELEYKPIILINIHSILDHNNNFKPMISNYLDSFSDKYLIVGYYEDLSLAFDLKENNNLNNYYDELYEIFDYVIYVNFTENATNLLYKYESKLSLYNVGLLGAIEGHFLNNYNTMIKWKDSIAFGNVDKDFNFFKMANLKNYNINELQTVARILL